VRSSRTDGIDSVVAQAKAAAGDEDVVVQGAYTAQQPLEAGVLDELLICHVPVLFGAGRRLFDTPEATHIRYRVRRPGVAA
jgi:dihydrofolate reductase